MERSSRVQQLYGYAVCLVAIITALIAASNLVDAAFARMDPVRAAESRYGYEGSLSSFEAYQATAPSQGRGNSGMAPRMNDTATAADTLSTAELRNRYEVLREDRIGRMSFDANQRLVKHGVLLIVAVLLFVWHWRWLRSKHDDELPPARTAT